MPNVTVKTLRIADAATLRRLGVYKGSLKKIELAIRRLLSISEKDCLLASWQDENGEEENGFIAMIPDAFHPETGRLQIHTPDPRSLPSLLEMAARSGFIEHNYLRIETLIPVDHPQVKPVYEAFGFRTDCVLRGSAFRLSDLGDLVQMSLLKTQNPFPSVGLIPYQYGLITVTGTAERVESLEFHMAGEQVSQPYLKDLFHIWRLLNGNGCLALSPDRIQEATAAPLPEMLQQAVDQLTGYLAGDRKQFDLFLELSCGSQFQQKVWAALQQIPFGTTVTYLDIAMQLSDGDLKKARSMTRAVGSACGANPVPIFVPCHRVIGHDGRLTGYSGGIKNKEFLLAHEMFGLR